MFNKEDTYTSQELTELRQLKAVYDDIGYHCVEISALKGTNIDQVKKLMASKVCMLSGHSGVGENNPCQHTFSDVEYQNQSNFGAASARGAPQQHMPNCMSWILGQKSLIRQGLGGFGMIAFSPQELGGYFLNF
ncbi:MAG: hypothetical protein CM15mP59_1750 [Flavobacteriaceae bacterium]|nr:MAG: hypothetical protein CM15mP59_1750 [Flavobacteriaceae bacterium]